MIRDDVARTIGHGLAVGLALCVLLVGVFSASGAWADDEPAPGEPTVTATDEPVDPVPTAPPVPAEPVPAPTPEPAPVAPAGPTVVVLDDDQFRVLTIAAGLLVLTTSATYVVSMGGKRG